MEKELKNYLLCSVDCVESVIKDIEKAKYNLISYDQLKYYSYDYMCCIVFEGYNGNIELDDWDIGINGLREDESGYIEEILGKDRIEEIKKEICKNENLDEDEIYDSDIFENLSDNDINKIYNHFVNNNTKWINSEIDEFVEREFNNGRLILDGEMMKRVKVR